MTMLLQRLDETVETPAAAATILSELRRGAALATLHDDGAESRVATLVAVLRDGGEALGRVVWVSNPLRSPLTLERFFLQAAGPDADVRLERDPAALARMLADADDGAKRLLVVQQPESMDAELRDILAAMAPRLGPVQILFCGTTAFRPLLPRRTLVALRPVETELEQEPPRRQLFPVFFLIGLFAVCAAALWSDRPAELPGTVAAAQPAIQPAAPAPAISTASAATLEAAPTPPAPSSPVAAPPVVPATSVAPVVAAPPKPPPPTQAAVNVTSLRQQFDQFLSERSPRLASLSPAQREALFQEFLRSRNIREPESIAR